MIKKGKRQARLIYGALIRYFKKTSLYPVYQKYFQLRIVTKYILGEFILTSLICFLFFLIIFIINDVLLNIKPLLEKDIPAGLVFRMLISLFPFHIIMSLPFGMMLSTLMVMGRFSSDNEIVAFRALGFHIMDVFRPIFIIGFITTIIAFITNDQLVPIGMKERKKTYIKTLKVKPTVDFKSKMVKRYEDYDKIIFTEKVKDDKIEGLIIIDKDDKGEKRIISAEKATLLSPENIKGALELKMKNATVQFKNKDRPGDFNFGYSDTLSYLIKFYEFDEDSEEHLTPNEKNTYEIYQDVKFARLELKNEKKEKNREYLKMYEKGIYHENVIQLLQKKEFPYANYLNYLKAMDHIVENLNEIRSRKIRIGSLNFNLIEFYRKFTFPLACIIFIIFAAPIGIYSKRAGYSIGFVIGLFLTAIYWFTFYGCWILGRKKLLLPFLAMSLPNILFLLIGIYFLLKRLKE